MKKKTNYQALDSGRITKTISTLSIRIDERFPNSGLYGVSQKLLEIAQQAEQQADWIDKPIMGLRMGIGAFMVLIVGGLIGAVYALNTTIKKIDLIEFISVFESGVNDIGLIAVALFFLVTLESRFKRHKALKAINELRAIAHIIDMHQLTKDPVRFIWESKGMIESKNKMTLLQLTRYLDYCSEMLSLVGKVSVLYVQRFDDSVALSAVNEVENLTTGFSRKIWQKLIIMQGNENITKADGVVSGSE